MSEHGTTHGPDVPWARPAGSILIAPSPDLFSQGLSHLSGKRAWFGAFASLVLLGFTMFVLPWPIARGLDLRDSTQPPEAWSLFLLLFKSLSAALTLLALVLLRSEWKIPPAAFGLRIGGMVRQILLSFPVLIAVYISVVVVGVPIAVLLEQQGHQEEFLRRIEFMENFQFPDLRMMLVTMVCVAIHEEIIFRGLLIPFVRRIGLNWTGAVVVSSVLFAILHLDQGWSAALQVGAVALVLGAAFVRTRSLLTVICAHAMFDIGQALLVRLFSLDAIRDALQQSAQA